MKDFLKQVPGFRSDIIWKKIVAGFFYFAFIFSVFSGGLEGSFVFGGFILLGVSIIELVKNKKNNISLKTPILLLLTGIILLSSGTQAASRSAIASKETEELQLMSEENEELKTEINVLKEDKEKLESTNLELTEENDKFIAEENRKKEELAKKEEEAKLVEEQKKEEEAQKAKQAKEQKEKENLAARSKETTNSNNSSSNSNSNQSVSKSAPAQAGPENTEQVLVTPTGLKYHRRKCGNGNYSPTTLNDAKARGLTPCAKCY